MQVYLQDAVVKGKTGAIVKMPGKVATVDLTVRLVLTAWVLCKFILATRKKRKAMETVNKWNMWANSHTNIFTDVLRILYGVFILV
jgi:hypothetical protein